MKSFDTDNYLNAEGLRCPMPLLKAKQKLNTMQSGQLLTVTTTDAKSLSDFKSFADIAGHHLLKVEQNAGICILMIKKG